MQGSADLPPEAEGDIGKETNENRRPETPSLEREGTTTRDADTTAALGEISVDLAGLFVHGRRLASQQDTPGLVHLIAHVGRELTACVIRERAEELPTDRQSPGVDGDNEAFRDKIASATGLTRDDPTVGRWFEAHQVLVGAAHARPDSHGVAATSGSQSLARVRSAFDTVAELLFAFVVPYFQTESTILSIAASLPSSTNAVSLRNLLLRPIQRRRFYERLDTESWIAPLDDAGFFSKVPERRVFDDGSWRIEPWPEGEYLLRVAGQAPERVVEILMRVPATIVNPAVWSVIAKAPAVLPTPLAERLQPLLLGAVATHPLRIIEQDLLIGLRALAEAQSESALALAEALLYIRKPHVSPATAGESQQQYSSRLQTVRWRQSDTDDWILARIDGYAFGEILGLFPKLSSIAPRRWMQFLARQLQRANQVVDIQHRSNTNAMNAARSAIDAASANASPGAASAVDDDSDLGAHYSNESHRWCPEFESDAASGHVRASLAVSLLSVARQLAQDEESAEVVLQELGQYKNDVFVRLSIRLLADLESLPGSLQRRLDGIVASPDAIDPPYEAHEIAALFRAHFESASDQAQETFEQSLRAGPGDTYVESLIAFWERADTSEERNSIVAVWQKRRLRWFHDRLPSILQPLATEVGLTPAVPSAENQSLDETGSWGDRNVYSASPRSPISSEDLASLSPEELVRYLQTWRPSESEGDPFERPDEQGLMYALGGLTRSAPEKTLAIVPLLKTMSLQVYYVYSIVGAVQTAIRQKAAVDINGVLALAEYAWYRAETPSAEDAEGLRGSLRIAACDLIDAATDAEMVTPELREDFWKFVEAVVDADSTWDSRAVAEEPSTFEAARSRATSTLAGHAVNLLMTLAWWDFLREHPNATWPPPDGSMAASVAIPLLSSILDRSGAASAGARATLGRWLPHLFWLAKSWTAERLPQIVGAGTTSPVDEPGWGHYLTRNTVLSPVFGILRPWYAATAAALPVDGNPVFQDAGAALSTALTEHVMIGVIRGLCAPGEPDFLVANVFRRVPVEIRSHAYWMIWRAWKDSDPVHLAPFAENVTCFWEWRLRDLEDSQPGPLQESEADGLCWLIATPHIPAAEAIRLGKRTTLLLGTADRSGRMVWDRLNELAGIDVHGAFDIAEAIIDRALRADHVYLPFDDVAPLLRLAVRAEHLRPRALRLMNRLGERGRDEFRSLWRESTDG